jgi:hypothetical protein
MSRHVLTAFLAPAIALALAAPALAQSPAPAPRAESHAVGLYLSNMSGSGLSYQRLFGNGWGFRVSGIGWGQGSSAFINAGAEVTKEIDRNDWGSLYGLLATGVGLGTFTGNSGAGLGGGSNLQANLAPGLGLQWGLLNVEIGYSIYTNSGGVGFTPAGGAGLMWRF